MNNNHNTSTKYAQNMEDSPDGRHKPLIYSGKKMGGGKIYAVLSAMHNEIAALRAEVAALRVQLAPASVQGSVELPVPEETWGALEAEGIVNAEHIPTCSRAEAAVLAHLLGRRYGIEGWAPFERAWGIPRLRNHWQKALMSRKTDELIGRYGNVIGC